MSFSKRDVSSDPREPRTVLTKEGPTKVLSDDHKHSSVRGKYSICLSVFLSKKPLSMLDIDSKSWRLIPASKQAS